MLGPYKIVADSFCEVYDILKPWVDQEFWDFASHDPVPGAWYLIGRRQFSLNVAKIRDLVERDVCRVILSNPSEGSETMKGQCNAMDVADLCHNGKILIIGGGGMDARFRCLQHDGFLTKMLNYEENRQTVARSPEIYHKTSKPYKFLFLNGRMRPHRKYLLERFLVNGLLDQSLWSSLDARDGASRKISFRHDGEDLMYRVRPAKFLPQKYEVEKYSQRLDLPQPADTFLKNHLFNNDWGEIYLKAEPYIDTYFSLVTETVFDYPHSFRTEKIWKPIVMGHPWIAVANAGYYRDMRKLGFRTFENLIDESFDSIENSQNRIERIADVVEDLCRRDLAGFLLAAQEVCKYNQQQFEEVRHRIVQDFPEQFHQFIDQNHQ